MSAYSSSDISAQSGKEYDFAEKKPGKEGRPIPILSNYLPIKVSSRVIYHYDIDIQVHDFIAEKNKGDRNVPQRNRLLQQKKLIKGSNFEIFDRLIKQETTVFTSEPIFDGSKNIYSTTKLKIDGRGTFQVKQKIPERKFPAVFDIVITTPKESHELNLEILNDPNVRSAEKELQALDTILQYGPRKHKLAVGKNMFLRAKDLVELNLNQRKKIRFDIGEMKEVSFGHYQSAKLTEDGVQLNVDRVAMVFHKGGKLLNLMEKLCTEMRAGPTRRDGPPPRSVEINANFRLNPKEKTLLNKELKGLSFTVDHISYKPQSTIFGLTDHSVQDITFDRKLRDSDKTEKISVKQYFEETYKDYIHKLGRPLFGNLPCVQVGKQNAKYFPLEVVSINDDQYTFKSLKPKQQSEMVTVCGQQRPTERFDEGRQQAKMLIESRPGQTDYLRHFNIQLKTDWSQTKGRVLDNANLLYKDNKKCNPREGQWRSDAYVTPATNVGSNWMLINFVKDEYNPIKYPPQRNQIDDFVKTLLSCSRNQGMDLQKPCEIIYDEEYRGRADLKEAFSEYLRDYPNLKLIVFMIPKLDELYNNIKFISEIEFGIVTQCVSHEKARSYSQMAYVGNLMLKINAKLGGTNVHLDPSCKVGFLKKKCMIMGLDVTHPSRHDRLGNSIASVVATFDSKMVNYFSKCVVQPKARLEIVELGVIAKEMLENFRNRNKFYPDFILVYRDGCSEGQFNEVIDKEINLLKKACSDISPTYVPKITFLVVQKRHHTRFLALNDRDRIQKSQNVLPGTVVDNSIVSNYFHDFYLNAHYGALGTSRPTRYTVLYDDSGMTGDEIQKTTNLLSYLFPRCTKATSVVPPVLFAHLAAKRARSYLFIYDNNRGIVFGEAELSPQEISDLNNKLIVKDSLKNILYFV